jgi:archaellum component FlaC
VNSRLDAVVLRLGRVEEKLAKVRRDMAGDAETTAHVQVQMDRMDARVRRIEHRLDLVEELTE